MAIEYPDSRHVTDVELDTATDSDIWAWAGEHDDVIVSKDSDFRQLAFLHGPPPKAAACDGADDRPLHSGLYSAGFRG